MSSSGSITFKFLVKFEVFYLFYSIDKQNHKILAACNSDCLLNRNEPAVYCEIKSHDLSSIRECERFPFFQLWWRGVDRPNRIQYLILSDIPEVSERNSILKQLLGDFHIRRFWLQCAANATNKLLIGFYTIIGTYKYSRNFMLDTIVEVDIHEIESYLSTTVNFLFSIMFEIKLVIF